MNGGLRKSSVETKVAAAIAVSFLALIFGVVAQESSQGGTHQASQKNSMLARELSNANRPDPDSPLFERKKAGVEIPDGVSQRRVVTEVPHSAQSNDD